MASHADYFMTARAMYLEASGERVDGSPRIPMLAVGCSIRNRVAKNHGTFYGEVTRKWAISSVTAPGDPNLVKYPPESDAIWQLAQNLAQGVVDGELADVTGGANLYFNPAAIEAGKTFKLPDGRVIRFPIGWDASKVTFCCQYDDHYFFHEA